MPATAFAIVTRARRASRGRSALERIMARTIEGPTVRPELGPCLDTTYRVSPLTRAAPQIFISVGKRRPITRIVLEAVLGRPLGAGMFALHRCDRPKCVRPDHLYEGTHEQNVRDREERHPRRGEQVPTAKLTADRVRALRQRRASGESLKDLALEAGIDIGTVSRVVRGQLWRHVGGAVDVN
jgi:HNH endonuclease